MPNLSHTAVHQFWSDYQDPVIYRVIAFMEAVEEWALDGDPALEEAIERLGVALEDIDNVEIGEEEAAVKLVAGVKTGRGLRILMAIDTAYPGSAAKILMHAEEKTESDADLPGVFLRRNIVFERLRLLGRVFGKDRFELILKALEDGGYD